jgi:hypothetical protein
MDAKFGLLISVFMCHVRRNQDIFYDYNTIKYLKIKMQITLSLFIGKLCASTFSLITQLLNTN